jgi:hypothetical protein
MDTGQGQGTHKVLADCWRTDVVARLRLVVIGVAEAIMLSGSLGVPAAVNSYGWVVACDAGNCMTCLSVLSSSGK